MIRLGFPETSSIGESQVNHGEPFGGASLTHRRNTHGDSPGTPVEHEYGTLVFLLISGHIP